jgi:hypothetical protein
VTPDSAAATASSPPTISSASPRAMSIRVG